MMKLMKNMLLCSLLLIYSSAKPQKIDRNSGVMITETVPANPVLKGLEANPLVRVSVYVPAGTSPVNYRSLQGSLNKEALNAIEKLDVYFTDSEPLFAATNPVSSFRPTATSFSIPLDLTLKPGMHHIWISATLKPSADIDTRIDFHAKKMTDASAKSYPVKEDRSGAAKPFGIAIRKANDDGVHTYRIPGIAATDKGTLLAVYDIRYKHSGDLPANIDVGLSRSTDGGKTWEPMKIIMDMGAPHENNGVGDPAILFDPVTKKIWVAALWSKGNRSIAGSEPGLSADTTGQFVLVSSDDDGRTWSQPYSITNQIKDPKWHLYFNGPGNGIAMANGTLVFPSQYWDESRKPGIPHAALIFSEDHGKSWKSGSGAKSNTTESQIVETTAGTLMLNMRDNRGGFRSVATTTDLGTTWVEHHTSFNALPDPVCMASFIKARVKVKGHLKDVLFFSNPNTTSGRYNLTIKASTDLGESWQPEHELLLDDRKSFGYSALTRIDDETIGILYEGSRDLYFVRVPVSEILK
jgi:sialidase-1